MMTPDKGKLILSSDHEASASASGDLQMMPISMRLPDSTSTGCLISTPMKEACKGLMQSYLRHSVSLKEITPLGLTFGEMLSFAPLGNMPRWDTLDLPGLPQPPQWQGSALMPFYSTDQGHQIISKLISLFSDYQRIQKYLQEQFLFSRQTRYCLEHLCGGTEGFVSIATQKILLLQENISQLQSVILHLTGNIFPSTEQRFQDFSRKVVSDFAFLHHTIQQIFQLLQDFDSSTTQISMNIIQEHIQPILQRITYLEQDILRVATGVTTEEQPSISISTTALEDISHIPLIKQRLCILEDFVHKEYSENYSENSVPAHVWNYFYLTS